MKINKKEGRKRKRGREELENERGGKKMEIRNRGKKK